MSEYYEKEPVEHLFEDADIEYKTVDESPDNGAYRFISRWHGDDSMVETTLDDFGRYAAVLDLFVGSSAERSRLYRSIRAGRNNCYVPAEHVWTGDPRPIDNDDDQFELRNAGYYFFDDDYSAVNEAQERFMEAYDAAREHILAQEP